MMGKDIHERKDQLEFLKLRIRQIDQFMSHIQPESAGKNDLERIISELEKTLDKGRKFLKDWE